MSNHPSLSVDITLVGGGVAGLWTLARLRQLGYQAILIENDELGGGQTTASQGIIHGGTKYALTGKVSQATDSIAAMPKRWLDCLSNQPESNGDIDLSSVNRLSEYQYLWTEKSIATKLTGFFASKVMQSKMALIHQSDYASFFKQKDQGQSFKGNVYQLNEPVIDTKQLIETLVEQNKEDIVSADIEAINHVDEKVYELVTSEGVIKTTSLVLLAGNGNQHLYEMVKKNTLASSSFNNDEYKPVVMQQRPLQMLMLKGNLPKIYAHRLGVSALPTLTITSHKTEAQENIWYIGGELAENYAQAPPEKLILAAKKSLKKLIPWQDFDGVKWSTLKVNRAEPLMDNGQRPDTFYVKADKRLIIAWPVKLALTPLLADKIIDAIKDLGLNVNQHKEKKETLSDQFKKPEIARMPWDKTGNWYD